MARKSQAGSIDPAPLLTCGRVWCTDLVYWKETTQCVGRFRSLRYEEGEAWMDIEVEGRKSEHLLKYLSGIKQGKIQGHICPEGCSQEISGDSIVHVLKVKKLEEKDALGWMGNLLAVGRDPPDELDLLRQEAREGGARSPPAGREGDPLGAKDKKEKKEKEKVKKKKEKRQRSTSPEQVEEKRRKGSRGRPRRKWTGSRSEEKEALSSKSKALDEEEKEKEEFFVFEPEQFKGRQQWEQRLDSHGRIGALWPDKNGQKGGGSVPGSANSLLAVGRSGAAPDVPRSNVGPGQAGVAPYIPAIFQGPPGGPDAACHEKGGGPRLLLPGLGVAGEDPTVAGHASSALESVGRSDHGKTLVRHFPIRASTRRTGVGGDSARNAGGCPGSQGSQQAEEYGWEAVRERPRKGRRMEERKPKRQGLKRARQRKGVAKRLKGRRTGFSARERGREGQGEEQRERRMTMRGADPLRRQNGQGAVRGHASLGEEVRGLAPGLSTPGLGVKERLSGMRFEVSPAKAPHTFVEAVWDEEEKSSLAWEYPPSETRHGTTPFFERESGNLEGRKVVEMGDLLNEIWMAFNLLVFCTAGHSPWVLELNKFFLYLCHLKSLEVLHSPAWQRLPAAP